MTTQLRAKNALNRLLKNAKDLLEHVEHTEQQQEQQQQQQETLTSTDELLTSISGLLLDATYEFDKIRMLEDLQSGELQTLHEVSEEFTNDYDIVLAAVRQIHGEELVYASEALQNNKDIVLAAVSHYCWALEYASEELQNDRDIVLAAVNRDGGTWRYASDALKDDREIVRIAVRNNIDVFEALSDHLKNDREIALLAAQGGEWNWLPEVFRGDMHFIVVALRRAICRWGLMDVKGILEGTSADIHEKFQRVRAMRNDPRGVLCGFEDEYDGVDSLDDFVSVESDRCSFLRSVQLHRDLLPSATQSILEFDNVKAKLEDLRLVQEVLPIIRACKEVGMELDAVLDCFRRGIL